MSCMLFSGKKCSLCYEEEKMGEEEREVFSSLLFSVLYVERKFLHGECL